MAWIAMLPIGPMKIEGGLMNLYRSISGKVFINMTAKARMMQMLQDALPEVVKAGDIELEGMIKGFINSISTNKYLILKDVQASADAIAARISRLISEATAVTAGALSDLYQAASKSAWPIKTDAKATLSMLNAAISDTKASISTELFNLLSHARTELVTTGELSTRTLQDLFNGLVTHFTAAAGATPTQIVTGVKGISTPKAIKGFLGSVPTESIDDIIAKLPPADQTLIATTSYNKLVGTSAWKRIKDAIAKLIPTGSKFGKYAFMTAAIAIPYAVYKEITFALFIKEETQQTYGFAVTNLSKGNAQKFKEQLQRQQQNLDTNWQYYIPLFCTLYSYMQFWKASADNIASHDLKKINDDIKKQDSDKAKDATVFPEELIITPFEVYDGDTIYFYYQTHKTELRLLGVNTPESAKPTIYKTGPGGEKVIATQGHPAQPYSKEATKWLTWQVLNRAITIKIDPANQRDKYNRILATVYLGDKNICLAAIRAGWAAIDFIGENKYVNQTEYKNAQDLAQAEGRGIWQGGKTVSITEIKRRYLAGLMNITTATIALENLLIPTEGIKDYLALWDAEIAKKKPPVITPSAPITPGTPGAPVIPELTQAQKDALHYAELKKLTRIEQEVILRQYVIIGKQIPSSEDGRIRKIMEMEKRGAPPAPAPAPTPAPAADVPTAPPTPAPAQPAPTPAPVAPPVIQAPELPDTNINTGETQADAKSKREIIIWEMVKAQQIKHLKDDLNYRGVIPSLEKDRVALIMRLEISYAAAAPSTPGMGMKPGVNVATPSLPDLKNQQAALQGQLNQDKILLQTLQSKALRLSLNYKQNWQQLKDLNKEIATVEARIAANEKRVSDVHRLILTAQAKQPAPRAPGAAQTPTAIPTTGQLLGTQPVAPSTDRPPAGTQMTTRENELWNWDPDQLRQKLITLRMPADNIDKLNKSERIANIMRLEGSAPAAQPAAPATPAQPTGYAPANGAINQPLLVELTWPIMDDAIEYLVYFGASTIGWQPVSTGIVPKLAKYDLRYNTKYYWMVISKGQARTVTSIVMNFTTAPAPVAAPPVIQPPARDTSGDTTYTRDDYTSFPEDTFIRHALEAGLQVTLDARANIIDIWDPATGNVYSSIGDLIGNRNKTYLET